MLDNHLVHLAAGGIGLQPLHQRVGQQRDIGMLERLVDAQHLGVGLGAYTRHGKPSQVLQRMQRLLCGFFSSSMTPRGMWKGSARRREIVVQLLDARLVADGGIGIGSAGWRFGRIFAALSVHVIQILGLGVVGLQIVIADRPAGEMPPWWRSSPKSSLRRRNRAAP